MDLDGYWLILVVLALIAGAVIVYLALTTFKSTTETIIVDFGVTLVTVGDIVADLVDDIATLLLLLSDTVVTITTNIFTLVNATVVTIVNVIVTITDAIVNLINTVVNAYTVAFSNMIDSVIAFWNGTVQSLYQEFLSFPAQIEGQAHACGKTLPV